MSEPSVATRASEEARSSGGDNPSNPRDGRGTSNASLTTLTTFAY
jgi:hypothetical protein